ncbi:hypothetical protein WMY93_012847 [Mugilogobius chulae]|uniref:Sulfotransferase n=1 Tax=Mugilogobius chulae TaxID=88201 RepID=A0AAW0NYB0_9GOBI
MCVRELREAPRNTDTRHDHEPGQRRCGSEELWVRELWVRGAVGQRSCGSEELRVRGAAVVTSYGACFSVISTPWRATSARSTDHVLVKLFRYGASRTLCETPVCPAFKPEPNGPSGSATGSVTDSMTVVKQVCSSKTHVALKTVSLLLRGATAGGGDLRPLLDDPRLNIKVVHLLPDGSVPGAAQLLDELENLRTEPRNLKTHQLSMFCADIYNSVSTALRRPAWLRGRYMLVRYEDLSRSPLQKTKEIYDFVGLTMTPKMEEWIRVNTKATGDAQTQDMFGTTRDSAANAESWR